MDSQTSLRFHWALVIPWRSPRSTGQGDRLDPGLRFWGTVLRSWTRFSIVAKTILVVDKKFGDFFWLLTHEVSVQIKVERGNPSPKSSFEPAIVHFGSCGGLPTNF